MKKDNDRPKFGQQVVAWHKVIKTRRSRGYDGDIHRVDVEWLPSPKKIEGIYIGYRDVKEGRLFTFEDAQSEFKQLRIVRVWLIVEGERRNPIHVLPDDVEWQREG